MSTEIINMNTRSVARLLKALGDETRLRIVAMLAQGELCVCHFEGALGISQPNASRQIAILRNAGVVDARREGNWIHYRLVPQEDTDCDRILCSLIQTFQRKDGLRRDVDRLRKARGPAACERRASAE